MRTPLVLLLLCAATQQQEIVFSRFGERYDEAVDAIHSITARLEALLSQPGTRATKNFLVSPLSMAVAVGELILGARGALRDELHDLLVLQSHNHTSSVRHHNADQIAYHSLHQQLGDLLVHLRTSKEDDFVLDTSSALFQQLDLPLRQKYKECVTKYYRTEVIALDFVDKLAEAEARVNKWANESTRGLITKLYPGGIPANTVAILANAVYFKADWEEPFSSEHNLVGQFRTARDEAINVTYMRGEFENFRFAEDRALGCRMAVLPYLGGGLNMYILLPDEDGGAEFDINAFSARLSPQNISSLVARARRRKVAIWLPRMRLSSTVNLLKPLEKYHKYKGLHAAAGPNDIDAKIRLYEGTPLGSAERVPLDLAGISDHAAFRLSSITQQVTVSVHENGTEAAAISAGIVNYMLDSVSFRVTRPFLFFIRHEESGADLFWGTIVNPAEV